MSHNQISQKIQESLTFITKDYVLMVIINTLYIFALTEGLAQVGLHATNTAAQAGLGMKMTIFGTVLTLSSIVVLISRPLAGALSANGMIKPLQAISLLILAVSFLLIGWSPNAPVFITGQVVRGIAFGLAGTVMPVMVRDSVPQDQYQKALGFYFMVPMIANVGAPSLSVLLYNTYGFGWAASLGALLLIVAALLTLLVQGKYASENNKEKKTSVKLTKNSFIPHIALPVLPYAIANIFVGMCFTAVMQNFVIFDEKIGMRIFALWMTVYSTISIFGSAIAGIASSKIGNKPTILICLGCIAVAMAIFAFTESYPLFIVAAIFYALGQSGFVTPMLAASMDLVAPQEAANASSTMYMGADLGGIISGVAIGFLVDKLGFHNMYGVASVCALIAFALVIFTVSHKNAVKS